MENNYTDIEKFFKDFYVDEQIILHRPVFSGNEKQYLIDCIDSNFVSSVGARVTEFNVSDKVVRIILSYTDYINRVVWQKIK